MAYTTIKNRLKRARASTHAGEDLGIVAAAIARKAYYDELTEDEKNAYCNYRGSDREAMEAVEAMITGSLHFPVERKPKPPTEAQFRERVKEVEALMQEITDEYNTPEAKAKREAEYLELQEIGRQRAAAFQRGEPMSNYPLPWERKGAEV